MNTQNQSSSLQDFVWWRLTEETYSPSILENIRTFTECFYSHEHRFAEGSAYAVQRSEDLCSRQEIINFLQDHASESSYFVPTVFSHLPVVFYKIVTINTGLVLWVDASNLCPLRPGIYNNVFHDDDHCENMLEEIATLSLKQYRLPFSPDPKFEIDDEVAFISLNPTIHAMRVVDRMWAEHPYSIAELDDWLEGGQTEFLYEEHGEVEYKTWVYFLKSMEEDSLVFTIASENYIRALTEEDINQIELKLFRELVCDDFALEGSPIPLFEVGEAVKWLPKVSDGRDAWFTYSFLWKQGSLAPFGLKGRIFSELVVIIRHRVWLEHPFSKSYLAYLENDARSNGFWCRKDTNIPPNTECWVYAIAISIDGARAIYIVPEDQLQKHQLPELVNYIERADNPGEFILSNKVNQLTLPVRKSMFWDMALQPPPSLMFSQEELGFTIIPLLIMKSHEQ